MDKIVGNMPNIYTTRIKWIVWCIGCAVWTFGSLRAVDHTVQMSLRSAEGDPVTEATAGVPFQLVVTVSDCNNTSARPVIEGLQQLTVHSQGFSMTSVNGKATTHYVYTVSCDTPGEYRVGPAQVMLDDNTIASGQLVVPVREHLVTEQSTEASDKKTMPSYFLRARLDKEQLYVGEPVWCAIRLYTAHDGISITNIIKPTLPDFAQRDTVVQSSGTETINGVPYTYHEWRWQIVPQVAGKKIIPAFGADVQVPVTSSSMFANMRAFMRMMAEHKRMYSAPVSVYIMPLPDHEGPVHVMGPVHTLTASLDTAVAKEGEGVVLSLRFTGSGDLHALDSYTLQEMPEELKWYASKQYMVTPDKKSSSPQHRDDERVDHVSGERAKVFEYIVQGLAAGDYIIPAQTCTYFDTAAKQYTTISSEPVHLTIVGGTVKKQSTHSAASDTKTAVAGSNNQSIDVGISDSTVLPLNTEGPWCAVAPRALPWWLFTLLLFFLGAGILMRVVRMVYMRLKQVYAARTHASRATKHAQAILKKVMRDHDVSGVYSLFVQLFAVLLDMPETAVQDVVIEQALKDVGLSEEQLGAWRNFFTKAAECSFYVSHMSVNEREQFFKSAQTWLDSIAVRFRE